MKCRSTNRRSALLIVHTAHSHHTLAQYRTSQARAVPDFVGQTPSLARILYAWYPILRSSVPHNYQQKRRTLGGRGTSYQIAYYLSERSLYPPYQHYPGHSGGRGLIAYVSTGHGVGRA
eukprot:705750-Rhodomonas_salina.2